MTQRILVKRGFTVPDKYVELADCEVLCEKCQGTGEYRVYFGPPGGWDGMTTCPDCDGTGKRLKCTNCGHIEYHAKLRHDNPELDTLCYNCIKAKLGFNSQSKEE